MIVRAPRPRQHFTILSNTVLRDQALSWKARGLLAYLLSQPDGWRTSTDRLAQVAPDGRDSVRTAMRELETHGYVARIRRQDDAGRWHTLVIVREDPTAAPTVDAPVDNATNDPQPTPEKPTSDNPALHKGPSTKDGTRLVASQLKNTGPRLCRNCHGAGWHPTPHGLERCDCDAGVRL